MEDAAKHFAYRSHHSTEREPQDAHGSRRCLLEALTDVIGCRERPVSAAAAAGGMIVIVIEGFIQLGDLRVRGLRLFWCREDRSKVIAPDMVYQARAGGFDGPPKTAPWWRGRDRPEYRAGCASPRRGTVARPIPARRAGAARKDPSI